MKIVLRASGLLKRFGKILAVDGLSFEVQKGEVFGILGPNGAGKSTTLAMITGLVRPDEGTIELFGCELEQNFKRAVRNLGVLLENPGFYSHLSAFDNLCLFGRVKKSSPAEIHRILEIVGIKAYSKKKVRTFSQGMRKRLGLANALIGWPKLLILDEPTSGLDPRGTKIILNLIKSLAAEKKISVVIASNLLFDIEAICDRALLIDKGRAIFCRSVSELLKQSDNSYVLRVEPIKKAELMIKSLGTVRSVECTGEGYLRLVLSGLSPAELNRKLVEQGFDVFELNPVKKTLQELFLQFKF